MRSTGPQRWDFRRRAPSEASSRPCAGWGSKARLADETWEPAVLEQLGSGIPAERAVAWLRSIGQAVLHADLPAQRADLIRAVYERIVVAGLTFVGARLTPAASQHGLALALPQVVRARPTGVGRAITTCTIPIEGRDEWLEAARAAERPA